MMNKIFLSLIVVVLFATGCQKKSDYLLNKTPDERLSEALQQYQDVLTGAPYGWKVLVYPQGLVSAYGVTSVFSYYMKFKDSNFVTMYSDFDTVTAVIPKTSAYRLKALQRPSIEFDSYGYIHLPCDPDPVISKSPVASEGGGYGWGSDFDFSFADNVSPGQLGDTIHLMGNFNHSPAIMVRATQAEQTAYNNQGLKNAMIFNKILNYYKQINFGGNSFEVTPGSGPRDVYFKWLDDAGNLQSSASVSYSYTLDGIYFSSPVSAKSQTIKSIDNIVFDPASSVASVKVNGTPGTLQGVIASLRTDSAAPARWYATTATNFNACWRSSTAFHVNGADDGLGIAKAVPNFYQYWYWYHAISTTIDFFGPMIISAGALTNAPYYSRVKAGPAFANGKAVFTLNANTGTHPAAVASTTSLFYNAAGWYFVQVDNVTYDMVLASDAKSWIRWTHN